MSFKKAWKKILYFLWEDESIWSWLANVALAFLIIKFILYPGLGYTLGTPAPIVAVVSGSMEHEGNFDAFWSDSICCPPGCTKQMIQGPFYESINISRAGFRDFDFVNGFNKGDIMILKSAKNAELGDVIVYIARHRPDPIIHRTVRITEEDGKRFFWTKRRPQLQLWRF